MCLTRAFIRRAGDGLAHITPLPHACCSPASPITFRQVDSEEANLVVDGEGRPVPLRLRDTIFLLLSGVYVRHGSTSASCMRELTRLISKTPFFHGDMRVGAGAGLGGVSGPGATGRTLLDFAVEVRVGHGGG